MPSLTEAGILGAVLLILLTQTVPKILQMKSGSPDKLPERNKEEIDKLRCRNDEIFDRLGDLGERIVGLTVVVEGIDARVP